MEREEDAATARAVHLLPPPYFSPSCPLSGWQFAPYFATATNSA